MASSSTHQYGAGQTARYQVSAPGYFSSEGTILMDGDKTVTARLERKIKLTITVKDGSNNNITAANVVLKLNGTTVATPTYDSAIGGFVCNDLHAGIYDLEVSASGYNSDTRQITLTYADVTENVVLTPAVVNYTLTVNVVDDNTSNPINDASVTFTTI